jgi:SAM-dependent methyltransferase
MDRLTEKSYWDGTYALDRESAVMLDDWRTYCNTEIYKRMSPLIGGCRRVLEVGAGDSPWLPMLSRRFPSTRFSGLDYSETGCRRLSDRLKRLGVEADIRLADIFEPPADLLGAFDLALSFGVVEHFSELRAVLSAKAAFLRPGGTMFTLIPNMTGINGRLTKRWNRAVYDIHVPHDLASFLEGHCEAGLQLVQSGYLGSSNFGVLSSCFDRPAGPAYFAYRQLTRMTKLLWLLESKGVPIPATRGFSPYIFAIARKPPEHAVSRQN